MIIILRTKSFDGYGSGHLKRSMILANEIKKVKDNKIDIIIALEGDKASFEIIEKTKLKYLKLPIDVNLKDEMKFYDKFEIKIFILDVFSRNLINEKYYKSISNLLVVFSDMGENSSFSDILICPQLIKKRIFRSSPNQRILQGTKYFIIDNYFKKIRSKQFKLENKKNIFVCLGGFAADRALLKICNALIENKSFIRKVVIVTGYNSKLNIKNIFSNHDIDFTIFDYCKDILKYLSLTNLAIISGGHIKYEAAALGIPSIIISIVKHQETLSSIFEKTNSSIYLGNYKKIKSKNLSKNIQNILLNDDKLNKMSEAGLKSIDGRGLKRVIENILDFNSSK